ncbi:hypothetical protein M2424_004395 [Bradyrhizobium japonicum]|nr:hypothetical protein [Bradyrhizobium japonicum]
MRLIRLILFDLALILLASGVAKAMNVAAGASSPVGRSKSPGYGHLKLPHLMIAVSAAEQQ